VVSLVPWSSELKPGVCPCHEYCSANAATPYFAGAALTPVRQSCRRRRCAAPARNSARSSQTPELAATGTRACLPPPCCLELPTPEPSAVSTEHPRASASTPRRRPELSAAGTKAVAATALLSPSLSCYFPLSPSARRSRRGRKPVNGRSRLGSTLSHPVHTAISKQRRCYRQAGHACSARAQVAAVPSSASAEDRTPPSLNCVLALPLQAACPG
jgi:hypothetical protein